MRRASAVSLALAVAGLLCVLSPIAAAAPPDRQQHGSRTQITDLSFDLGRLLGLPYVPGEVLVRLRPRLATRQRADVLSDLGLVVKRRLVLPRVRLVGIPAGLSVEDAVAALERDPRVEYAEPNAYTEGHEIPDDPQFGRQWGLHNTGQLVFDNDTKTEVAGREDDDIDAPEAWERTTDAPGVRVAVADSGIDLNNKDLNTWQNSGETGLDASGKARSSNGKDDDGNSFVDDWRGWDFVDKEENPTDRQMHWHGSHVAGIIGARGDNGTGITGVARSTTLVPIRVFDENNDGTCADMAEGLTYAASDLRVPLVNLSGGARPPSSQEEPACKGTMAIAIREAPNTLFVVSAGNQETNVDDPRDAGTPVYPCSFGFSNMICVAATDQNDDLSGFSNYGVESVDLAAPGENILSYCAVIGCNGNAGPGLLIADGTSQAAPHVTGVAALLLSLNPSLTPQQIKERILDSVDPLTSLSGKTVTGGRLNAARALAPPPIVEVPEIPKPRAPGNRQEPVNPAEDEPTLTAKARIRAEEPAVSYDGRIIAFSRQTDRIRRYLYLVDTDGTGLSRLSRGPDSDSSPAFSRSGVIAFVRRGDIYTLNPASNQARRVTHGRARDLDPTFTRGGRIVFTRTRKGGSNLYAVRVNGTGLERVTAGHSDRQPAVSPDGRIAFSRADDNNRDIYVMVPGRRPRRLTKSSDPDTDPAFAPDGRLLAFVRTIDGNSGIRTVGIDGKRLRRLAPSSLDEASPAFLHDGVVFTRRLRNGAQLRRVALDGTRLLAIER